MNTENQAEFGILGETEDFLAVDKPAGLLVHPTKPGGPRTLWDGLNEMLRYELATGGQISIINRLDRETSGVVLIAKSSAAARYAGIAMQRGQIAKEYLALAFGWPDWDEITVDQPILRLGEVAKSDVWLKRAVHPNGAEARTRFQVVDRLQVSNGEKVSIIRAFPETGRTHQIRVHLAYVNYPIIGDKLYAKGSHHYLNFIEHGWTEDHARALWLPRHALHCTRMTLDAQSWESPLPADLKALIAS